jgi:hypothetical protein
MNTTLKPDNPLFEDYQNIINSFYNDLPHQSYLEKYIVKKFFAWAEDYLEAMIIVHENLIEKHKKEEEDKTQVIELVQDKLDYYLRKKKEIEPFSIKISDFNNEAFTSEKLEEHYADFNKETNLIKLKPKEETTLKSGFFIGYLNKVFDDLMESIEEFYLNNKDNYLDSLNICFKELDEFKTDNSRLKKLFKNEPNIYYKKIDLEEFKFLTNQKWNILRDFISEKRILCEHYSSPKYKNRNKEIILKTFNSIDSFDEFKWIADELNVNFDDIDKRGNSVKLFAIFDSSKTEHLFKKNISKIEYADTLTEIYKSKKLNPKNHSDTMKQVSYIDDIYSSRHYSK